MIENAAILDFVCEILFVKDPHIYSEEIWEELCILLEVHLDESDLEALGNLSEEEARKMRVEVLSELITSGVYFQMNELISASVHTERRPAKAPIASDENAFICSVLSSLGLGYEPETVGIFSFHTKIAGFPVYVWTSRELKINIEMLQTLLKLASQNGYEHLYIVVPPQLSNKLPEKISGYIAFDFLPAIYEDPVLEKNPHGKLIEKDNF